MYPWISRTLVFWLQFCEKKCGLYMDVYGNYHFMSLNYNKEPHLAAGGCSVQAGEGA